ncbi:hypothetical protein FV242_24020 [Methylobacterium sp. WL64]|uniref:hypothetical protein n=1 Tax=Methylobacterium sp. WL64 TaxID=2603894 RepID=UPI0011CA2D24|nr:hypothetical protein [Methylobacterium sp. WL64]TXM99884.1 hypothetical protein FV242_24020 [Methylobacterium sp. WL64]
MGIREEMIPMKPCYTSCLIIARATSTLFICFLRGLPLWALLLTGFTGKTSPVPSEQSAPWSLRQFELLDQFSGAAESNESNAYLKAVADTLEIANTFLASNGKKRLFCSETALDVSMLRVVVRGRILFLSELGREAQAAKARSGVVVAILQALRERFPCR